jgi:hypothetical protein
MTLATTPARIPPPTAASGPQFVSFMITAATAPESASTDPTERSMSPLAITNVRPTARSEISENASRIAKLLSSPPQKSGLAHKPNSQSATMRITAAASRR